MISVVLPVYNEEKNVRIFVKDILRVFSKNKIKGEIIIVDDGSTDNSLKVIKKLADHKLVRFYQNKVNMGKSFALKKGFIHAKGDIVFMIDVDLQHSAEDIPKFIKKIREGYDVVNGWRRYRKDGNSKRVPSRIYNSLTKRLFNLNVHDFNCGFKAFKREVIEQLSMMSGEHRFIIPLARKVGFNVGELEVKHFPRKYGRSKYNYKRIFGGMLDLITLRVRFILGNKPMKIFAGVGGLLLFLGFLLGFHIFYIKYLLGQDLGAGRPIVILDVLLLISGVQLFFFGFVFDSINELKQSINDRVFKK